MISEVLMIFLKNIGLIFVSLNEIMQLDGRLPSQNHINETTKV